MSNRRSRKRDEYIITSYGSYATVNKAADRVARQTGMEKALVRQIVKAFLHELIREMALHKRFYIPGIALFNPIEKKGMKIRNYGKEEIEVEPKITYWVKIHPLIELLLNPNRKQNYFQRRLLAQMDRKLERMSLYSRYRHKRGLE